MQRKRPLILVCNDDGIEAPGLFALAGAMDEIGKVVVIAPVDEQSAVGHAITLHDPVRTSPWRFNGAMSHVEAVAIGGTPVDCIKLALNRILPRRPDLVVSGINRGPNTAINVVYSGTVSAATESSIRGIDSIAFSLCSAQPQDYSAAARFAKAIARKVLRSRIPRGVILNVNIPAIPYEEIKGVVVTRLARSCWEETFIQRTDPLDQPYYWYYGDFVNLDEGADTDIHAVEHGYVSLTPIQYDLTAHGCLGVLRTWRWADHLT